MRVAEGVVADGRGHHNSFPIGQDEVLHPAKRLDLTETLTENMMVLRILTVISEFEGGDDLCRMSAHGGQ